MSRLSQFNYADYYPQSISTDDTVIDNILRNRDDITYHQPSVSDFEYAIEWLSLYEVVDFLDHENPEEDPHLQAFANVIAFMVSQITTKTRRTITNNMKREYAKAHGVPFKQLRIKKGA